MTFAVWGLTGVACEKSPSPGDWTSDTSDADADTDTDADTDADTDTDADADADADTDADADADADADSDADADADSDSDSDADADSDSDSDSDADADSDGPIVPDGISLFSEEVTCSDPDARVTEGPDHDKRFHATVEVANEVFGPASGTSRKRAEQVAALLACQALEGRENGGPE